MAKPRPVHTSFVRDELVHLSARFDTFRRNHPPGTTIPTELRSEVVAAVDAGVPPTRVWKVCRISTTQLTAWRAKAGKSTPAPAVLAIIDEAPRSTAPITLDLQIDGWQVRISFEPPRANDEEA